MGEYWPHLSFVATPVQAAHPHRKSHPVRCIGLSRLVHAQLRKLRGIFNGGRPILILGKECICP